MGLTLVTPPTGEPLALSVAKAHLRVDSDDEDVLITGYIQAAREYVERATGRALYTQTWDYTVDDFPYPDPIRLPRAPIQSISYLKYYDSGGVLSTLDSATYIFDPSSAFGELALAYNATWPAYQLRRNAITVRFVAGYGDTPNDVPMPLRAAVQLMTAQLYMNRESVTEPPTVTALLDPFRVTLVA